MRMTREYTIIDVHLSKYGPPKLVLTRPIGGVEKSTTISRFTKEAMLRHGMALSPSKLVDKRLRAVFRSKRLPYRSPSSTGPRRINRGALSPEDLCIFGLQKTEVLWGRNQRYAQKPKHELHLSSHFTGDTMGFVSNAPSPWFTFFLELTPEEFAQAAKLPEEYGFSVRLSLV